MLELKRAASLQRLFPDYASVAIVSLLYSRCATRGRRLVFLGECGSHIALTPLYARARHPACGPMAVFRVIQEAIREALAAITAQDALGWFRHCGSQPAELAN